MPIHINEKRNNKIPDTIRGIVKTIYEDFETGPPIIKEKAIAFLLEIEDNDKIIVVYDKNAVKLGLIKKGRPIICLGKKDGTITVKDKDKIKMERFLCMAILVDTDSEDLEEKEGAITLDEYMKMRR